MRDERAQNIVGGHREHEARDVRRSCKRDGEGTPQARGARRAPIVRKGRSAEHREHETRDARRSGMRDDGGAPRARDARRMPIVGKG